METLAAGLIGMNELGCAQSSVSTKFDLTHSRSPMPRDRLVAAGHEFLTGVAPSPVSPAPDAPAVTTKALAGTSLLRSTPKSFWLDGPPAATSPVGAALTRGDHYSI